MALSWKLLDYMSGMVIRSEGLPVSDESAEVSHDIHGEDTAEIDIIREKLTANENNNWRETFALLIRGIALDDDSKAWNDPSAIDMSGFINKLNDDINPRKIKAQVTGLTEYTKGRIVADTWTPVSDPTTTVDFTGSNWPEVMASAFAKCLSAAGTPAGKPKPYNILGKIKYPDGTEIVPSGTTVKKSVKVTDAMTYHELLTSISDEAGGLEWQTVTRWTDSTRTQVVVDIIIGTSAVPHINEDVTLSLNLAENDAKFSGYSGTFDSNELYSKLYIQSVPGDETTKTGADFTVASVDDTEFPVLFERFFNPGVALTTAERDAQLTSRLAFAAKPKYETSITVEEKFDPSEWRAHMGKKLILTGVDNTPSAGHDATVRIVGITTMPEKGTVKAQLMQLGPTYPRLPKDRIQGLTGVDRGNSNPVLSTPSIGGGVPVVPAPVTPGGFGVDGVLSPSDLWGSEGHNPWDVNQNKVSNVSFKNFLEKEYTYTDFLGKHPFDPTSAFLDEGNRVYGLDNIKQAVATKFETTGANVDYLGGLNKATGLPNNNWQPFYIKKTYLINGELGPIEEIGEVSSDMIKGMMAEWEDQTYTNGGYYKSSIMASNWVTNGRYYFCLLHQYNHSEGTVFDRMSDYSLSKYIANSKVSTISKAIDSSTGHLVGDWTTEASDLFPEWFFPVNKNIARFGKNLIFTGAFLHNGKKLKNMGESALDAYMSDFYAKYQFSPKLPMRGGGNVKTDANSMSSYLWPIAYSGQSIDDIPMVLRKNFSTNNSGYQTVAGGNGQGTSSNGYLAVDNQVFFKLATNTISGNAITNNIKDQGFSVNGYYNELVATKGNFITFGSNAYGNAACAWSIDAANISSVWKKIDDINVPKFEFWINGQYQNYADGILAGGGAYIVQFADYWQPNGGGAYFSVSDIMSYDGSIYKFILSGANKIIIHSMQVIENPTPPTP